MKAEKARRDDTFIDDIVEALKSVPKNRLRIVRDVVEALADAGVRERDGKRLKRATRKSLLKTPFCGIWKGRTDIGKSQSYAKILRQGLETRGDRN